MANLTIIFCPNCKMTRVGIIDVPGQPPKCKLCGSRQTEQVVRARQWRAVGRRAKKAKAK